MTREFRDDEGKLWEAFALDAIVAHGKRGAALAFRPAGDGDAEPILSTVTFNSTDAAEFALGSMGVKELRRRLGMARGVTT